MGDFEAVRHTVGEIGAVFNRGVIEIVAPARSEPVWIASELSDILLNPFEGGNLLEQTEVCRAARILYFQRWVRKGYFIDLTFITVL